MDNKKFASQLNRVMLNQFEALKSQKEWKELFPSVEAQASVEELFIAWLPSAGNNAAQVIDIEQSVSELDAKSKASIREKAMNHLDNAKALLNDAGYTLNISITNINRNLE